MVGKGSELKEGCIKSAQGKCLRRGSINGRQAFFNETQHSLTHHESSDQPQEPLCA